MRRLPKQKALAAATVTNLRVQTTAVNAKAAADQKDEAERLFNNARKTVWFGAITKELKSLAGPGERCMYCSGSESSDVEHFRPKAIFPLLSFEWSNYLWSCTPCNRSKSNRFPPITAAGAQCINPLKENVWDFFFIDDYGFLTPKFDTTTGVLNARAESTKILLDLNREGLQQSRQMRVVDLKRQIKKLVKDLNAGTATKTGAKKLVRDLRRQPFQPDVADYFLKGPGKATSPFSLLFAII